MTGQPDFAHIVIDYIPGEWLVESKSLKLFFTSFRNHGDFHEACTLQIADRLIELLSPVLAAHRRVLVSARRHADRRVLADRGAAGRGVDPAAGRAGISWPRLTSKPAIIARARALGFDAIGFTRASLSPERAAGLRRISGSGPSRRDALDGANGPSSGPTRKRYGRRR